jgi:hypothetical protein
VIDRFGGGGPFGGGGRFCGARSRSEPVPTAEPVEGAAVGIMDEDEAVAGNPFSFTESPELATYAGGGYFGGGGRGRGTVGSIRGSLSALLLLLAACRGS